MIILGAELIADDRVAVSLMGDHVTLRAPPSLPDAIEARGVGLLATPLAGPRPLRLVVDLSQSETRRLPERNEVQILDQTFPCLHKVDMAHFPFAVIHYLRHGILTT